MHLNTFIFQNIKLFGANKNCGDNFYSLNEWRKSLEYDGEFYLPPTESIQILDVLIEQWLDSQTDIVDFIEGLYLIKPDLARQALFYYTCSVLPQISFSKPFFFQEFLEVWKAEKENCIEKYKIIFNQIFDSTSEQDFFLLPTNKIREILFENSFLSFIETMSSCALINSRNEIFKCVNDYQMIQEIKKIIVQDLKFEDTIKMFEAVGYYDNNQFGFISSKQYKSITVWELSMFQLLTVDGIIMKDRFSLFTPNILYVSWKLARLVQANTGALL